MLFLAQWSPRPKVSVENDTGNELRRKLWYHGRFPARRGMPPIPGRDRAYLDESEGTLVMRSLATSLATVSLMLLGLFSTWQEAQGQAPASGIGFRNDLKIPVIVQGVSLVNNMQRRGQPFLVNAGKTVWDNNLPVGARYYTIYDANQQRILLRERPVRVQNADQFFGIRLVVGGRRTGENRPRTRSRAVINPPLPNNRASPDASPWNYRRRACKCGCRRWPGWPGLRCQVGSRRRG